MASQPRAKVPDLTEYSRDALLALYDECSLMKDRNSVNFVKRCDSQVNQLKDSRVKASDFEVKAVVGRGHFGEVAVVAEKRTGKIFAMKTMKKGDILRQSDAAFFLEERDIMAWSTSSWLTSLMYSFQDSTQLYLAMEYHPGGDLLTVLERASEVLDESGVRFYLAEVTAGLQDLHQLGFVHRDMKPDNVLLTASGHIKLADFGSAARLQAGRVVNAALPVGTPEYIAPEVLTTLDSAAKGGANYGVCCDWWSLGILGFELLAGVTPFEGESTSETYANIMNYKKCLRFPKEVDFSEHFKDLIKNLLTSMGDRYGYNQIRSQPFFDKTPWDNLLSMRPPFVPSVRAADDTSNFEPPDSPTKRPKPVKSGQKEFGGTLPFVGFTFSRRDPLSCSLQRTGTEDLTMRLESSENELSDMIAGVKGMLQSREKALEQVAQSHKLLQEESIIKQSELEELQRTLEVERSERDTADSKTFELLGEVREYHQKIADLKETKARETIDQYQRALVLAEKEKKDTLLKVSSLQSLLKRQMKQHEETIKEKEELHAKLSELNSNHRSATTALHNKVFQLHQETALKQKEMQGQLDKVDREKMALQDQLNDLREGAGSSVLKRLRQQVDTLQGCHDNDVAKLQQMKEELLRKDSALGSSQSELLSLKEDLAARDHLHQLSEAKLKEELETAQKEKERFEKLSISQEQKLQSLEAILAEKTSVAVSLEKKLQLSEAERTELRERQQTAISNLERSLKVQVEVGSSESEVQKKLKELESEACQLSKEVCQLKEELSRCEYEKKALQNEATLEKEKLKHKLSQQTAALERETHSNQLLQREREVAQESVRSLTTEKEELEKTLIRETKKLVKLSEEKTKLLTEMSKLEKNVRELEKTFKEKDDALQEANDSVSSLERRISHFREGRTLLLSENEQIKNELCKLRQENETCKMNDEEAERKVQELEDKVGTLKRQSELLQNKESEWKELQETLSSDLDIAENRLEETAKLLEKERALRVQTEEENARSLEIFQKSSMQHSEEVRKYQETNHRQKEIAQEYSRRITELEREKAAQSIELDSAQLKLQKMSAEASTTQRELQDVRRELNILKAAHLKLTQEQASSSAAVEQLTVAEQLKQQELAALMANKAEQEFKLQTTIDQQAKLISLMQDHTPSKPSTGAKLKKHLHKFVGRHRQRNPQKEVEEWGNLKGLIRSKDKSLTIPSPSKLGRASLMQSPAGSSVSQSPRRSPRLQAASVSASSSLQSISSTQSTEPSHVVLSVKHNIPHKFSRRLAGPGKKCSFCKSVIRSTQHLMKCKHCKKMFHNGCSAKAGDTCGLPDELAEMTSPFPPAKRSKMQPADTKSGGHHLSPSSSIGTDLSISSDMFSEIL